MMGSCYGVGPVVPDGFAISTTGYFLPSLRLVRQNDMLRTYGLALASFLVLVLVIALPWMMFFFAMPATEHGRPHIGK